MSRRSVWRADHTLVIAHRGGLEHAPENTLDAFRSAVELGSDFLETDVHRTADGVLVAFHDDELDRVTDAVGRVADLPYAAVAEARLEGGRSIPTLDELIESLPEAKLNIDVKSNDAVEAFVATVRRHNIVDRIGVGAFSDSRIRTLRRLIGPRLSTVGSPREVSVLMAAARLSRESRPVDQGSQDPTMHPQRRRAAYDAVQVPISQGPVRIVTRRFINHAHRNGVLVHVWTVNDADEMNELLDLGVDGIITDRPERLKRVLAERRDRSS